LSPHLQVYGWSWTMAMSVLHRASGVANALGLGLVAVWLVCLATSEGAYEGFRAVAGSWLGRLFLVGWSFSLLLHLLGGVRHLIWDFGLGMEREQRRLMAKASLAGAVGLTLLVWLAVALG
jgi:succinate dehydrogenase / fumarate reductase cytochrome b subunit